MIAPARSAAVTYVYRLRSHIVSLVVLASRPLCVDSSWRAGQKLAASFLRDATALQRFIEREYSCRMFARH